MSGGANKLDLFLRGSRNYIQGTQIIARTAELLPPGAWRLEQATFSAIALNELSATRDGDEAGALGRVSFTDGAQTITYALHETGPQLWGLGHGAALSLAMKPPALWTNTMKALPRPVQLAIGWFLTLSWVALLSYIAANNLLKAQT